MKLNEKDLELMINKMTEKVLQDKGLTEVISKMKFNEKPLDQMDKYEKTMKYFQAQVDGDRALVKDLSGGTAGAGLELIPQEFHADIIDRVTKDPQALRNRCTTVPVNSRSGVFPVGATGVTLTWESSDTNPLTPTAPTFTNLNFSVARLDAYTAMARDLLSDTPVALYDFLANQYSKAFVKAENQAIINGTGTNQPAGVRIAAGVLSQAAATAATTNILTPDDVIALPYAIDVSWRSNGIYIANSKTIKQMKMFKDLQNRYLWTNGDLLNGTPDKFNGYPVFEFSALFPENLTVNSKTTCTEMLFGNFDYYYIFDKNEMGSEINTQSDTAFKNHECLIKMWERLDGKVAIPTAFVRLTGFLC